MILQETRDLSLLVARNAEDVAKSAPREDNLFAGSLGILDGFPWINLGSANGRDEGAP